jgi:NADPH2:quinone reductase
MRAIVVREYGGPEVLRLEEAPDPVPGAGRLLVRVVAAGVQFIETRTRTGALRGVSPVAPLELPWIPGREVAGEVAAVGEGVDTAWLGRRVAGTTVGLGGGYASLALVEADSAHHLPDGLAFPDAVSLLGTGGTALGLIEAAEIGAGDTVLIESAAGAVGLLSAQLARAAGAKRVIGLAGGPEKLALVKEFGADAAIDYTEQDWPAQVRAAAPDGVSVVFDANGGEVGKRAFELLGQGGRFVMFGFSEGEMTKADPAEAAERGISILSFFGPPTGLRSPQERYRQTAEVIAAVAAGRLRPHVGRRFPLAQAAEAHASIASRATIGKTVLEP